jgi:glycosyltransferase involved in cell wall biosynthesis
MKIGIYSPYVFSQVTGRAKVSRLLALTLEKLGVEVRLLNAKPSTSDNTLSGEDYNLLVDFTKRDFTPDVIISFVPLEEEYTCKKVGILCDLFNSVPPSFNADLWDEIWIPSKATYTMLTKSKKQLADKAHWVPFGIDTDVFKPGEKIISISDELNTKFDFIYGFIGEYNPRKGIDILLQAHYDMFDSNSSVALFIKGDMRGAKHLLKDTQLIESNMQKKEFPIIVYSFNTFKDTELAAIYRAIDLFVTLTRGEWFGLSVLEAMGCGVPVVATLTSALKDFKEHIFPVKTVTNSKLLDSLDGRYEGSLFSEPDIEHYKRLVLDIYNKEIDTSSKVQSAREFVVDNYSLSAFSKNIENRLETLLGT